MASKFRIDPANITTVLTSCGRFDLLGETVASFLDFFDATRIIVAEDSDKRIEAATFAKKFPSVDMRINTPRLGQMGSIDRLYATLTTPWVLHLEDDWRFSRSLDLDRVIDFLTVRTDVSVVCIAHGVYNPKYSSKSGKTLHGGIDYRVWDLDAHPKWFSYSFNPTVARLDFWRHHGPFQRFGVEQDVSQFCKERGMRIAHVDPGIADHIGDKRHVADPFQPARAKTPLARLKRSIAKRLARLSPGG